MHGWCSLYYVTPDYQALSFAFICLLWPIVAKKLLRIRDDDGFSGDLQVVRGRL